jgi:hypothetical protein
LADSLKRNFPDLIDIHVFSSTEGSAWTIEDFSGYIERGMEVHLDGKSHMYTYLKVQVKYS